MTIWNITSLSPWWLLSLAPVGAVAIRVLFRPARRHVAVPSLQLWSRAVAELSHAGKRYSRRVTASWLCLLVGAVCAALALARPTMFTSSPARRVAVAVCPSAEIATEKGLASLRNAAAALLDRFSGDDRVQLLLPAEYPQDAAAGLLSPADVRKQISQLKAIPAAADELHFPPAESGVQHTYIITPAGTKQSGGLNTTVIELPTNLPPITFDAFAATIQPDGKADIFAKIRNTTDKVQGVAHMFGNHSGQPVTLAGGRISVGSIQPGEVYGATWLLPATDTLFVWTCNPILVKDLDVNHPNANVAWLVRRDRRRVRLAVVGPDEPMLRRYIESDPLLELWGDAKDADVLVINVSTVPAVAKNKPALVINPAAAPAGWRRGPEKRNVVLDEADLAADDPILRDVNLAGMAVRRMTPWIAGDFPSGRPLIHIDGEAVLLRNAPAAATAPGPRRVYVAFSLAAENTNLAVSEPFVILLANIFRWLAPEGKAEATYEWVSPLQAGDAHNWTSIRTGARQAMLKIFVNDPGALPLPGLYRDQAGRYHAVNLVGLRSAEPKIPADKSIAEAPLPAPAHMQRGVAFWPGLVIAAAALWLVGWALRLKN